MDNKVAVVAVYAVSAVVNYRSGLWSQCIVDIEVDHFAVGYRAKQGIAFFILYEDKSSSACYAVFSFHKLNLVNNGV